MNIVQYKYLGPFTFTWLILWTTYSLKTYETALSARLFRCIIDAVFDPQT